MEWLTTEDPESETVDKRSGERGLKEAEKETSDLSELQHKNRDPVTKWSLRISHVIPKMRQDHQRCAALTGKQPVITRLNTWHAFYDSKEQNINARLDWFEFKPCPCRETVR